MKHNAIFFVCVVMILLTPGCGRVIDWAENTFSQGKDVENFAKIPRAIHTFCDGV